MKKVTIKLAFLAFAAVLVAPLSMSAQDYDDLYYSPSKAKKERKAKEEARARALAAERAAREYSAADTYDTRPDRPLSMDVDAYNRRTVDESQAPAAARATEGNDFSYTRRIERYHNPDVVASSKDEELKEYYYNTPSESDINIYVINSIDPYYAWNTFWPTYSWNNPYYWNSWYNPFCGPTFSFSFGCNPWFGLSWGWGSPWYGPSCGWSWGWNSPWYPSWGWGHGWGHGWGWGHLPPPPPGHRPDYRPGRPNWAVNNPGTSRPRRPNAYQGANRHNSFDQNRPGAMGQGNRRPGNGNNEGYHSAPGSNGNHNYTPSNNSRRGNGNSRYGNSSSSPRNNNSNGYNGTRRNSNSNSGSNRNSNYNSGSNRGSNYNSGGSYGSGRGSSYGSGSRGGGGGASHGRRR